MSRFEPVSLPPDRVPDGAISMTALKHYNGCPRAGYLYLLWKGIGQSVPMIRGSAFHAIAERATLAMMAQGEPTIPGDLVKVIVSEVLAEMPVPIEEHDYLREMAYRWAEQTTIDPAGVLGVEQLVELDIGGWRVRCKMDLVQMLEGGLAVQVDDYKTSRAAPAFEEIARRRPDAKAGDPMMAKQFQLVLYGLAAAFGYPVHVQDGVEVRDPFPLAGQAQRFDLRLVFPGIENQEGRMAVRPVSVTRVELAEYRESLEGLLGRLDGSLASGDWPAVQSHGACSECPARQQCPIPRELRDFAGRINSFEELVEASERWEREDAEHGALRKEIKSYIEGAGLREVRFGRSRAWRFDYRESERIDRKDQMWEAIARAVEFGEPFEKSEFVRTVGSTSFKIVELSADELEESTEEVQS